MKRQSGFTLIELIIVIVILGILAVTAAPQFFNFGSDARESTVRSVEGSVKTASEMVHARAQVSNEENGTIEVRDGVNVTVRDFFATADEAGIIRALSLSDGDWNWGTAVGGVAVGDSQDNPASAGDFLIFPATKELGDSDDAETACFVYYSFAEDADAPYIGSVVSGC